MRDSIQHWHTAAGQLSLRGHAAGDHSPMCRALAASVDPEHVARAVRGTAHMDAVQLAWTRCRCTGRSVVQCTSTLTGLHVSMDCQRGRARAIGVAADGSGKRDDHRDLGDAMDIIEGMRWTWLGREVERLRRGRKVAHTGCAQASLVCRLRAELQAKIDEMRAKTSVLKRPKRGRAARRVIERGVVSLMGGHRCALLRHIGHAGAGAVVAHLEAGIARQTVCIWEQLLGANVLAHARAFYNDQYATNSDILQGSEAHVWEVTSFFHHAA